MKQKKWSDIPEKGNMFFFEIMIFFYRIGGKKLFNFFLIFVIFWYWLFSPLVRKSSYQYLTRLHQYFKTTSPFTEKPNFFSTYLHLYYFGRNLLEKMYGWFGVINEEHLKLFGWEHFQENYQKGAVVIVSHLGNTEIIRALRGNRQKINVLVYTKHAKTYNRMLEKYTVANQVEFIQIEDIDIAKALTLKDKIDKGEWILIAADRIPVQSDRVLCVDFLGYPADWPIGPWVLTNFFDCPVISLFCYLNHHQYEIHIGEMYEKIHFSKHNKEEVIKKAIEKYVKIMEKHCQKKPYLWFNFFNFWKENC